MAMKNPRLLSDLLLIVVLMSLNALPVDRVLAEPWTKAYAGGGEVSVDPRTNRATIRRNGVESMLWDGVHRLEDGGAITVRSGRVVPSREIIDSRRLPGKPEVYDQWTAGMWADEPAFAPSPCEKLVDRVCGTGRACAERENCSVSRQLLDFETEERAAGNLPNRMTRAGVECLQAERDRVYFTTCAP